MVMQTATVISGIMVSASAAVMRRLWGQRKLSYAALSIRFFNGILCPFRLYWKDVKENRSSSCGGPKVRFEG
jgi:uncharacterized membrane protein YdcZ (DUF606 family)